MLSLILLAQEEDTCHVLGQSCGPLGEGSTTTEMRLEVYLTSGESSDETVAPS